MFTGNLKWPMALPFLCVLMLASLGCQRQATQNVAQVVVRDASGIAIAPVAVDDDSAGWRDGGGGDPVKDRAHIRMSYRVDAGADDGTRFVRLRFASIEKDDAAVNLRVIDGAVFSNDQQPVVWKLPRAVTSELAVSVRLPENGRSFFVVEMRQGGGFTSRSIALK